MSFILMRMRVVLYLPLPSSGKAGDYGEDGRMDG
jgi:hypothetical protein